MTIESQSPEVNSKAVKNTVQSKRLTLCNKALFVFWGALTIGGGLAGAAIGNEIGHNMNQESMDNASKLEKCRQFVVSQLTDDGSTQIDAMDIPLQSRKDCRLNLATINKQLEEDGVRQVQYELPEGFTVAGITTKVKVELPKVEALDAQIADAHNDANDTSTLPIALGGIIGLAAGFVVLPAGLLVVDIIESGGL